MRGLTTEYIEFFLGNVQIQALPRIFSCDIAERMYGYFQSYAFRDRSPLYVRMRMHSSVLLLHTTHSALFYLNPVRRLAGFEADVAGFGEKSGDIFWVLAWVHR